MAWLAMWKVGFLSGQKGSTQTELFEFDELNRLTQAVTGNATKNTVYQANGNIQSRTGTGT